MKASNNNPPENALGPGVAEKDVADAVSVSGYPLQCIVASMLRKHLDVQEEWGFIDADEEAARSIDMIAEKRYWNVDDVKLRARPEIALLIECKRSDLPFVFFLADEKPRTPQFPVIAGLKSDEIEIKSDAEKSLWSLKIIDALGLGAHGFLRESVEFAHTFSRCERQGSRLRLSGSEPYNAIIYPVIKALDHLRKIEIPPKTYVYFDAIAAIGLAILDAPMIGVKVKGASQEIQLVPWIRIPRHRGSDNRSYIHRTNGFAVDFVHVSFLETYLTEHVLPFGEMFASRVRKHHIEVADCKGAVSGMLTGGLSNVEGRLSPR